MNITAEMQPVLKPIFKEAVTEGRLGAVHWDDLIVDATTLTHLKDTGRGFVEISLGYLPPENVLLPFEPYLRALIQAHWQGAIAEDDFLNQADDHIKLIRNADMKHNTCLTYDSAIYDNYHQTFAAYGYAVKDRLARFLGYVPQLEHSLIAEMWMRDIVGDETYRLPSEMTPDDIRAMTLIKYREVLLAEGKQAADLSPLLG
ncbi:hypothetical protein GCM10028816_30260 [Spirosoma lituiforme]